MATTMTGRRALGGAALLLTATIFWGGFFQVAQVILPQIDALWLGLIRYVGAALLFTGALLAAEGPTAFSFDGRVGATVAAGTLGFAGFNIIMFLGQQWTRPEHGALTMGLTPLITAVLLWIWLGYRPRAVTWICIAVAFLGIGLVITKGEPGKLAADSKALLGDGLAIIAVVCWAGYTLAARRFPAWSSLRYSALTCIASLPAFIIVAGGAALLGWSTPPTIPQMADLGVELAYSSALAAFAAALCWNRGIAAIGPANGPLFINFVPVTAFAIGIALGAQLTLAEVGGALLVIGALVVNSIAAQRRAAAA